MTRCEKYENLVPGDVIELNSIPTIVIDARNKIRAIANARGQASKLEFAVVTALYDGKIVSFSFLPWNMAKLIA